jgi:hypothetical protein
MRGTEEGGAGRGRDLDLRSAAPETNSKPIERLNCASIRIFKGQFFSVIPDRRCDVVENPAKRRPTGHSDE